MTTSGRPGSGGSKGSAAFSWDREGADWPHRDHSRFVDAHSLSWHVQVMGKGPVALLLHGTGATTHSWRDVAPILAEHFLVVAPDLPGHGFTGGGGGSTMSLPGMARGVQALLDALGLVPTFGIGHSAGAAVLAQMALCGTPFAGLVALNGAFLPIAGARIFSPLARLFASTSLVPRLFAWRAGERGAIDGLLKRTGSVIDEAGKEQYARLARNRVHVAGALAMMANWDLHALQRRLGDLTVPLLLIAGGNDRTIAPEDAFKVRDIVATASVEYVRGVGHLAHEERPQEITEIVLRFAHSRLQGGGEAP